MAKTKKRVCIVADVLVDEDFDINNLAICEYQNTGIDVDSLEFYLPQSDDFELLNYITTFGGEIE